MEMFAFARKHRNRIVIFNLHVVLLLFTAFCTESAFFVCLVHFSLFCLFLVLFLRANVDGTCSLELPEFVYKIIN